MGSGRDTCREKIFRGNDHFSRRFCALRNDARSVRAAFSNLNPFLMKNAFILTGASYGSACAVGVAAQLAGVLPIDLFSIPAIAGGYVLTGVLAIAFNDYTRPSIRNEHSKSDTRGIPAPEVAVPVSAIGTWQTVSA